VGNDQHRRSAAETTRQQYAWRVDERSRTGRPELDAFEQVFRGNATFGKVCKFALDLTKFLLSIGAQVLAHLQDLQFYLCDLSFALRDGGCELTLLSVEIDCLPFEPIDPHDGNEVLCK